MTTKVKVFELFHGACLTRLIRRDKPLTMRLIEVDSTQSWSTYRVNDVDLFIKHCANPRRLKTGRTSWTFPFGDNQIERIMKGCHVALICGAERVKDHMEICFIEHESVGRLLADSAKSITVSMQANQSFRVKSAAVSEKMVISRSAIDTFEVPA